MGVAFAFAIGDGSGTWPSRNQVSAEFASSIVAYW